MKGVCRKCFQLLCCVSLFFGTVLSARHLEDRLHPGRSGKVRLVSAAAFEHCESKPRGARDRYDSHFVSREAFAKFLNQYDTVVREEASDSFAIKWKRKIDGLRSAWKRTFNWKAASPSCAPALQIF